MKNHLKSRSAMLFFAFFLATAMILPSLLHAVPIPVEGLPKPGEMVLASDKDIPRHIFVATQYLRAGKFKEVLAICQRVLDMKKDNVEAHACLAGAYKGLGHEKEYEKEAGLIRKLAPRSPALYLSLATTYSALNDHKSAERSFKKGLKSASDKTELRMGLGALYVDEGRFKEAANQYSKVLEKKDLGPKYFLNASFALCRIDLRQKAYDQVIKRASTITELYPPIPQPYLFLASAYLAQDKTNQAVETYEKLMKNNPKSPVAYQELALIYNERLGDHAKALRYAEEAAEKFPDDPKSQDVLGWVYFNAGKYPEAVKRFEQANSLDKKNPFYRYHLGLALQKTGDRENAKNAFEEALRLVDKKAAGKFSGELQIRINQCK
jgi:tetratricopeptide (TPR) repeat protein